MTWPPAGQSRDAASEQLPRQLAVVDKLAKSIAHEMNNVLAAIVGLASVLDAEVDPASPAAQDVKGIIAASKKGLGLTQNLLAFAGPSRPHKQAVSLNHLCRLARSILLRTVPQDVKIELELTEGEATIEGDPSQLQQVLLNLGSNAIDAISGPGQVTFSTKAIELDAENATNRALPPGPYLRLQVSDTGGGMDSEILSKALEPFFTTKPQGTAAGLGLSLVCWTVAQHGGRVTVFSRKGLGTTVTVYFPASVNVEIIDRHSAPSQVQHKERPTILVVDDDKLVLRGAKRLLEMIGYNPVALGANDAVEYYRHHMPEVRAVILDLVMPERDGVEVLQDLKDMNPDATVIISSGYPMDQATQQVRVLGAADIMKKPYTLDELSKVLEQHLGDAAPPRA